MKINFFSRVLKKNGQVIKKLINDVQRTIELFLGCFIRQCQTMVTTDVEMPERLHGPDVRTMTQVEWK